MNNTNTSHGTQGLTNWDIVEIGYSFLAALFGVPLNVFIFFQLTHSIATKKHSRLTLLSLQINISDIMILVVKCVTYSGWMIASQWYAGNIACKLFQFFLLLPFYLSSNCRVALALDMFQSIYYPMSVRITGNRYAKIYIVVSWILAAGAAAPQLWLFKAATPIVMLETNPEFVQCYNLLLDGTEYYPALRAYNIYHLLAVFWIPLLIITALYGAITKEGFQAFNRQMGMKIGRGGRPSSTTKSNIFTSCAKHSPKVEERNTSPDTPDTSVTPLLIPSAIITKKIKDMDKRKSVCVQSERQMDHLSTSEISSIMVRSVSLKGPSKNKSPPRQKTGSAAFNSMEQDAFGKARQQKLKILKFSLSIIIAYVACWLPYQVKSLVECMADIRVAQFSDSYFHWLGAIMILNSCLNPFLYGFGQHSLSHQKKNTGSHFTATTNLSKM